MNDTDRLTKILRDLPTDGFTNWMTSTNTTANEKKDHIVPTPTEWREMVKDNQKWKKETNVRLSAIEDQVLLVRRDAIVEEEYEELKEAWEAYNYLLAKLRTFKAIKDSG